MNALVRRQLGRTDRHVRRGRVSLVADAPRHKLIFMAEESLRLCSLPGEEEGRVYYFRRLRIAGLPADGDRRFWLDAFQKAMQVQAAQAVHGLNSHAETADSVYFRGELEACEGLLTRIAARMPPTAWFWPHVAGGTAISNAPAMGVAVIERLLATQASWSAAAAAVLSVARERDVAALLEAFPSQVIEHWLHEMGTLDAARFVSSRLPEAVLPILNRAIRTFGLDSPKVVWLASLAVIACDPSSADNRSAVARARATLQGLVAHLPIAAQTIASSIQQTNATLTATNTLPAPPSTPLGESDRAVETLSDSNQSATVRTRSERCFGESTTGAGLYFLLNALHCLQVEEQHFSLFFLAHLLLRIARDAGIVPGDPILRWAEVIEAHREPEVLDDRLLRIWMLNIRRWCWRNGHISVREIVRRPGYVTLTSTDLDVTLSIDSADVRIRRIGLDLDPGWLSWFGRVVHFHYRYRGELCG
jgi:hypothetical protein